MSLTIVIVIITVGASLAAWKNPSFMSKWIFNPYQVANRKQFYRFLTSGFIHKDTLHIIFNMFVLFLFGQQVENIFTQIFPATTGTILFGLLYVLGIIVSDIPTFLKYKDRPYYNALGASGGVSSVLFCYIMFLPLEKLCLYGLDFLCFPGVLWGGIYLVYSYFAGKKSADNINHDAHLYGALFGIIFTIVVYPRSVQIFLEQMKNFTLF